MVTVCVELTGGELERMITIYLSTANGTAIGKEMIHMYCRTINILPKLKLRERFHFSPRLLSLLHLYAL